MSGILHLPHQALQNAEERAVDACMKIADDSGLHACIRHEEAAEPHWVKLSIVFLPALLDPYERVAWRRTYIWGARHWKLPSALLGTRFTYSREEYEFAGATLRTTIPKGFFVAVRKSDGWMMFMTESFLRQTVLPAMPVGPAFISLFSIGLGEDEKYFV